MLQKTKGIILHQIKYTDSGIIAQVYTREFGRRPVLIRGMRNKKAGKHNIFFQPMSILDMVLYIKESREVQMLKEFSVYFAPADIYANVKKVSIAVFLSEILSSVLKEETPNEGLFDFIEGSVIYLDSCTSGYSNFHISFLAGLCSYLGFEPAKRSDAGKRYFDLVNGVFVPSPPPHNSFAEEDISDVLAGFFTGSFDSAARIPLTGSMRDEVLRTLIRYFSIHLPGLKKINSLEVLKDIFT